MVAAQVQQQFQHFLQQSRDRAGVGVLGDFCLDRFIFGSVDRISPEAPVPVLAQQRIENRLGCAANVVVNVAEFADSLDLEQHVFSVVGEDALGEELHASLQALKGDLRIHLIQDEGRPTTLKTRYLAGSHHQLLRVDTESRVALSLEVEDRLLQLIESRLPRLKMLVVQDYAKGVLTPRVLQETLAMARKSGVFVLLDPHRKSKVENYQGVDLFKPNIQEAEILLGHDWNLDGGRDSEQVHRAGLELQKRHHFKNVLITRSAYGMTWVDETGEAKHFPAIARSVFDVTGAGDTTVATLASFLSAGASIDLACSLSVAAASVVVAKVGTASASIEEIQNELSTTHLDASLS